MVSIKESIVLLIAFIGFVASEDFCQAFRGHGNGISYIYNQRLRQDDWQKFWYKIVPNRYATHSIIIDSKYWNLVFDSVSHNISFEANTSQSAPHFTDQYIGAACVWEGYQESGSCQTYLFPKNNTHKWVNETSIADNTFDTFRNLDEYSEPVTRQVLGMRSDEYVFVNDNGWKAEVEFVLGSGKRFNRLVLNFQMLENLTIFTSVIREDPSDGSYFDHNREIIGISNQYSDQKIDLGYLVLTKERQQVFWCWQSIQDHNVSKDYIQRLCKVYSQIIYVCLRITIS